MSCRLNNTNVWGKFLDVCFGTIPYGIFQTKAFLFKSGPLPETSAQTLRTSEKSLQGFFKREAGWKIVFNSILKKIRARNRPKMNSASIFSGGCHGGSHEILVAPYCAIPRDYLSDTPLLRAMGFLVSQHGQLGAIPPPPFLSASPLESMRSGGAIPPLKRGISAILARYPMKTRQMGAIPPLCDTISKGYCAIWGGISHWAAKHEIIQGVSLRLKPFHRCFSEAVCF